MSDLEILRQIAKAEIMSLTEDQLAEVVTILSKDHPELYQEIMQAESKT